ncbi:MAG: tetratricopeptide repeat protein [Niastella sp.]|nr:tetratricopeptide repeat protein [Niastella sp.]
MVNIVNAIPYKFLFYFLIFVLPATEILGQDKALADEEISMMKLADDTARINKMNAYAGKIQFSQPDKAIQVIEETIRIAEKINYSFGLSVAYGLRAGLLFYEMKLDSCKLLVDKAYALINNNTDLASRNQQANLINRYAAIEQRKQNYVSAVELYLKAVSIFDEMDNEPQIINSYYNLSGIYKFLGDTSKAFYYARETNRLALKVNDAVLRVRGLIALADIYNYIKDYDSLKLTSDKGLAKAYKDNMTFAIGIFHNFIGLYFTNKMRLFDSAVKHYEIALNAFKKINTSYDVALVLQNLGDLYLKKGDHINAIKFSKQARDISSELKFDHVLYTCLENLVIAEENLGNIGESYKYLKELVAINESINNRNSEKKVYEMEVKYQTQKREDMMLVQQKELHQKNMLNYLLAVAVLLLLIVVSLLYLNYRNKQKWQLQQINKLETQQQLSATKAVLKGEEQERSRLAKDLHDGLGGLLSGIKYSFNSIKENLTMDTETASAFERTMDMLNGSIIEMRQVAHNLMPQSLVKFGFDAALKDFCNQINQTGALHVSYQSYGLENEVIEETKLIIIYRIVQELISNTLKHARAVHVVVQVIKMGNNISITVEDDGIGFDVTTLPASRGIGWSNIQSRVDLLKGKLDVRSEAGNGTSVLIEFSI